MAEQSPPPLSRALQSRCPPQTGTGATAIPLLLDRLADRGGRPDSGRIAEGITAPHTAEGRTGKNLLQRAWLDSLTLPQLAEFRRACVTLDRQTLAGLFEDILALFGDQGGTD